MRWPPASAPAQGERRHGWQECARNQHRRREGERGEWIRAVEWCEKGLESDPCAEPLYRGLMTAYASLGRRSEALAVYQRCRKNLKAILEVGPSAETEAIYRQLQSA